MNKVVLTVLLFIAFSKCILAQTSEDKIKKWYAKSTYEYIFSWGNADDDSNSIDSTATDAQPVVRFSGFFNGGMQAHYNFSKSFGFYTGLGMRNVGFINKFGDSVTVKQREYTLGVPLAVKIGKVDNGFCLIAGGEVEMFFNYKQKVFYNNQKSKYNKWFSGNEELFNFSVFGELVSKGGSFIRFRYYLNDFLLENNKGIDLPNNGGKLAYDSKPSQLMYISIGSTIHFDKYSKKNSKKSNPRDNL